MMIMNEGLYFGINLPELLLVARGDMRAADAFTADGLLTKYIKGGDGEISLFIDLEECSYMDSTFIGFLISLTRLCGKSRLRDVIILRPSAKCLSALKKLYALPHLNIAAHPTPNIPVFALKKNADAFKDKKNVSLMFEAHKALSELSEENRQEFFELVEELARVLAKENEKKE